MGMYTQLVMGCSINPSKFSEIKPILNFMIDGLPLDNFQLPDHPLFNTDRWIHMLNSDSHYFDLKTHSHITTYNYCDTIHLSITCNVKNYCEEIQKFISWISPYLDNHTGEFLGFVRYEENKSPALIYLGEDLLYISHDEL